MTTTQTGLLIIQGIISAIVALYVAVECFKGKREKQRYQLYAVRDKLLYLEATGKFSDTRPLFSLFYHAIDKSIGEVKDLTFVSFLKASLRAKSALEQEKIASLRQQINNAGPEVQEFVGFFGKTMMQIMVTNSLFVALAIRAGSTGKQAWDATLGRTRIFTNQEKKIETYLYFKNFQCPAPA